MVNDYRTQCLPHTTAYGDLRLALVVFIDKCKPMNEALLPGISAGFAPVVERTALQPCLGVKTHPVANPGKLVVE